MTLPISRSRAFEPKVFLCFWLYSVLLLLFLSPDSYFHDLYDRCDSAWFFSAGKWWMQGLKPYIDFADSKGPLLWLIYGIGWLFSHHDYTGVWWLSTLSYAGTFYFTYRAALLFVPRRHAVICSLLMTFAFFLPPFHREIRAENWCHLFLSLSLWKMCAVCFGHDMGKRSTAWACYWLGLSTGALLLIKFNIAVVQGIMPLLAAWVIIREHRGFFKGLAAWFIGLLTVVLPIVLVLAAQGCLTAMINEYFMATAGFYSNDIVAQVAPLKGLLGDLLHCRLFLAYVVLVLAGIALTTLQLKTHKWLPAVVTAWMALTLLPSALFYYHFSILAFVFFPLAVSVVAWMSKKRRVSLIQARWIIALAALCVIADYAINHTSLDSSIVWNNDKDKEHVYYATVNVLSQFDHPSICYSQVEQGAETMADALPAVKYWCVPAHKQDTATADIIHAINRHAVDIVMTHVHPTDNDHGVTAALVSNGYHKCFNLDYYEKPWSVWSIRELPPFQLDYEASWQDVVLKRRPRFMRD